MISQNIMETDSIITFQHPPALVWQLYMQYSLVNVTLRKLLVKHNLPYVSHIFKTVFSAV
jgi:hypothetical protein